MSDSGQSTVDPNVLVDSWHAINDGERSLWWFTDRIGTHKLARHKATYEAYREEYGKGYLTESSDFRNTQKVEPIQAYQKYYLSLRVPFQIETFIDYPTAVCTPDALNTNVPFEQYYRTQLAKMQTVGTDMIGKWQCFHVKMSPNPQTHGRYIPTDIWFAVVGHQFIPVQFYLYDNSTSMMFRSVITVTKLLPVGNAYVPVGYRTSMDILETFPSGKTDFGAHLVPRYHEFNLLMSHINSSFPDNAFKIDIKPGTEMFHNNKFVKKI